LVLLRSYRDKKVVGVFVRFRAPLHRFNEQGAALCIAPGISTQGTRC
jgi:hypothetical protein